VREYNEAYYALLVHAANRFRSDLYEVIGPTIDLAVPVPLAEAKDAKADLAALLIVGGAATISSGTSTNEPTITVRSEA
jgi:hypothetical protein